MCLRSLLRSILRKLLKDLERCRRAQAFNDYPQTVFYAQQCVEKCAKALLEIKRRVVYIYGSELITTESLALQGGEEVRKDIAEKALLLAERVVEVTRNYLRERGIVQG